MNVESQWERALLNLPGNPEHKWPCDGALKDAFSWLRMLYALDFSASDIKCVKILCVLSFCWRGGSKSSLLGQYDRNWKHANTLLNIFVFNSFIWFASLSALVIFISCVSVHIASVMELWPCVRAYLKVPGLSWQNVCLLTFSVGFCPVQSDHFLNYVTGPLFPPLSKTPLQLTLVVVCRPVSGCFWRSLMPWKQCCQL
jgi:hypothetical protein